MLAFHQMIRVLTSRSIGPSPSSLGRPFFWGSVFLVWLSAAIYGATLLWGFSLEPGETPATAPQWPASSGLIAPSGRPMLVLFLHPLCPCSRATVEELSVLLAKAARPLQVQAVFVGAGQNGAVEKGTLWKQVQALPGVTLVSDPDGLEAERFRSVTSGDAFLYDSSGSLQYRGGLTGARGHAGDNFGVDSVVRIVQDGKPVSPVGGPVFGCLLTNSERPPRPKP